MEKFLTPSILINLNQAPIIFDYVSNGVTITDQHSSILYTNSAFTRITGYLKEEVKGENPGILHSGRHQKDFYEAMWEHITTHGFWEGEIWNRRKSGEIYPSLLTISKVPQEVVGEFVYIGIFADLSFLKEDIDQKLHLAFYDPLTELPNRSLYLERFKNTIESVKKSHKATMAVFYMDLNKFKEVNDRYGHCVGDSLLQMVGKRLSLIMRAGDTIARIGGDEFTAILTDIEDQPIAYRFAQRILDSISQPFLIEGHKIEISISIGISFYPQDARDEDLLRKADKAMYRAKKSGIKIASYDPSIDEK